MTDDLRLYEVSIGRRRTIMRLNAREAEAYGSRAQLVDERTRTTTTAVVRTPPDPAEPVDTKARLITSNKMRGIDPAHPSREGTK